MQKAGLAPTGILAKAAKTLGFASVAALLEVNPDAAAVMQAAKDAKPQASVKLYNNYAWCTVTMTAGIEHVMHVLQSVRCEATFYRLT